MPSIIIRGGMHVWSFHSSGVRLQRLLNSFEFQCSDFENF